MYILRKMKRTVRGVLAVFAGIILTLTGMSCASDEADSAITAEHLDGTTHDNYPIPGTDRKPLRVGLRVSCRRTGYYEVTTSTI